MTVRLCLPRTRNPEVKSTRRSLRCFADRGIFPSSITRAPHRPGSRRGSIASRRSGSFIRPSVSYSRARSSQDLLQSPASGVFIADSEEELSPTLEHRPLPPARVGSYQPAVSSPRRFDSKRKHRQSSTRGQDGYFDQRGRSYRDEDDVAGSPSSPLKGNALSKIASYMGFGRQDGDEPGDEEEGLTRRRRSSTRSRRESFDSQDSRQRSPSPSSSGWGLSDEDDDFSDRPEGEEGYTSSLADDTSLPPQSRPGSPSLPLIPKTGDDIFGERGRLSEDMEPKDFASTTVPSRQTILLPDEDLSIRFTCYQTDPLRRILWLLGCVVSLGALGLVGRWIPRTWVRFCGKETAFDEAKEGAWLVVEVSMMPSSPRRRTSVLTAADSLWRSPHHRPADHPVSLPLIHRLPPSHRARRDVLPHGFCQRQRAHERRRIPLLSSDSDSRT